MKKFFCFGILLQALFLFAGCDDDGSSSVFSAQDEISKDDDKGSSSSGKSSSSVKSSSSGKSSSSKALPYKVDPSTVKTGTFTDERDGRKYKYVTIGNQTWMAENLNFKTENGSSCAAGEKDKDCNTFGRIYSWAGLLDSENSLCTAMEKCEYPFQGVCPNGWHIPDIVEWDTLAVAMGGKSESYGESRYYDNIASRLLAKENCEKKYCGTDEYHFSVITQKDSLTGTTDFATSRNFNYENIYYHAGYTRGVYVSLSSSKLYVYGIDRRNGSFAIRCVKSENIPDLKNPATIKSNHKGCEDAVWSPKVKPCSDKKTDNCEREDGGIKIGTQIWKHGPKESVAVYRAASCEQGWHVPDSLEWEILFDNIGGKCFAGMMMKSASGWNEGNGLNAYGFDLKPTGYYGVWVDTEKRSASIDYRELTEPKTFTGYFVRKGESNDYRNIFGFGPTSSVSYKSIYHETGNLLCVKGYVQEFRDTALTVNPYLNPDFKYGEYTDPRDNQVYKTTVILNQKWMAENLNYETENSQSDHARFHGLFYNFEEARTACPAGWHLPSKTDFDTLLYLAAPNNHSYTLVSKRDRNANDSLGFSMAFVENNTSTGNSYAEFWSSDAASDTTSYALYSYHYGVSDTIRFLQARQSRYLSVRCLNDTSVAYGYSGDYGTLTDERDGNTYKTQEINGTTWMAENLRFNSKTSTCTSLRDACRTIGRHYPAPFVPDSSETLCPENWHVSTTADWDSLLAFVQKNGKDLMSIFGWHARAHGTDKYGFNVLPNTCLEKKYGYLDIYESNGVACLGAVDATNNASRYYLTVTSRDGMKRNFNFQRIDEDIEKKYFRYGIRCVKDD